MSTLTASALTPETAVARHVIPAGEPWVGEVKTGQTVRLLDLEGNQAVDTLFYSAANPRERYDPQRTLRRQASIYLSTGTVLYSNLGKPLLTIVADTCGRHDTLGGACAQESNTVRYALDKLHMHACRDNFLCGCLHDGRLDKGDIGANINFFMNVPVTPEGGLSFEDGNTVRYALDKLHMHACRDNFLCGCLHDGRLDKGDIGANINFFMNVPVTPEGGLSFEDGISAAGKYVELRAEMDVIVLISNCPQLNNPCNGYNPTPAEVLIWDAAAR